MDQDFIDKKILQKRYFFAQKFGDITKLLYLCGVKSNEIIDIMKWNELKRIAIAKGFHEVGHRGKHDEYYNPDTKVTILIERHWSQEVRPGLLSKLKKQIGF